MVTLFQSILGAGLVLACVSVAHAESLPVTAAESQLDHATRSVEKLQQCGPKLDKPVYHNCVREQREAQIWIWSHRDKPLVTGTWFESVAGGWDFKDNAIWAAEFANHRAAVDGRPSRLARGLGSAFNYTFHLSTKLKAGTLFHQRDS